MALPLETPVWGQAETRAEEIGFLRRDKTAQLWPETQSPLVDKLNKLVDRGLYEGFENTKGTNGWQIVLGGMRSGQGTTAGIGYRRSDLWHDRLGFRSTVRGTIWGAVMLDMGLDFQSLRTERSFIQLYAKYENSPRMDYYGQGQDSEEDDRTSFRLEDYGVDMDAGYELFKRFKIGGTLGYYHVHTGHGHRGGVPSIEEIFTSEDTPGLRQDTGFFRYGLFAQYDYRDSIAGPRSGGFYAVRHRRYEDLDLDQFGFHQLEIQAQQYLPYWNKTRVIALRFATIMSFPEDGQAIPFYLQPTLGGNDSLRGFERYRYYDDHAVMFTAEHRWYVFSGLDMAVFADAGKVVPRKGHINFGHLSVSGGVGFRFRIQNAVVMRVDFAFSEESARVCWTFSDIFKAEGWKW
ncbi:MAG TPA: BamA/TamA family outer membrane protein [Acidobacteriota bacterium]|nr:BamA/TamA family outer membrane protein [Acidobacteriota bacterium]HQM62772.1 BamA/TamA family outer membrane protein [Acidobacteriota bacterium]